MDLEVKLFNPRRVICEAVEITEENYQQVKHRGYIWSWLQQVSKYLLEEQEARKLCRELIKNNLVTID